MAMVSHAIAQAYREGAIPDTLRGNHRLELARLGMAPHRR